MKQQATATVLLVLTTAVCLAGCSLLEQLALPPPTSGPAGRVELSDAGLAVTFPSDWLLESRPSLSTGPSVAAVQPEGRDLVIPLATAVPPSRHDRCLVADVTPLVEAQSDWQSLDEVVGGFQRRLAADPRWVGLEATILQLPAGEAGRISWSVHGEAASVTAYLFAQPDGWYMLECFAQAVPAPDWRSIAATVEFLPGEDWVLAAEQVAAPPITALCRSLRSADHCARLSCTWPVRPSWARRVA